MSFTKIFYGGASAPDAVNGHITYNGKFKYQLIQTYAIPVGSTPEIVCAAFTTNTFYLEKIEPSRHHPWAI